MTEGPSNVKAKPITMKQQWLTIAVFVAAIIAVDLANYISDPVEYRRLNLNFFTAVGGLLLSGGHAIWLWMDRRRRGLYIGRWRYGIVFFPLPAVWMYLALEYRTRAIYFIGLCTAIYLVMAGFSQALMAIPR